MKLKLWGLLEVESSHAATLDWKKNPKNKSKAKKQQNILYPNMIFAFRIYKEVISHSCPVAQGTYLEYRELKTKGL